MNRLTNIYPDVPAHNNNQPFRNVSLATGDVQLAQDFVTVYSLEEFTQQHDDNNNDEEDINLKFIPNEFGYVELNSDSDDTSSSSSSSSSSSEDEEVVVLPQQQHPETISCVTCGCFGSKKEFHDDIHCTYDCAVITKVNESKRLRAELGSDDDDDDDDNKRIRLIDLVVVPDDEDSSSSSDGSSDSGRGTGRSGSSSGNDDALWERVNAPARLFINGIPSYSNPFRVTDVLEAIDPEHQSLFCPCVVVEVIGFRMLLKFIGFQDKYNFWVNADSIDIFPVNWCTTYTTSVTEPSTSRPLLHFHGPDDFNWETYIKSNNCRRSPESNFSHIHSILTTTPLVRVGMKLEAVDVRNQNLVCVATVSCVMGNRFLIHFDSWDSLYDYWADLSSPFIHPVGFCSENNIEITPPHCYENAAEFEWDEYLKKTGSVPVPKQLFRPIPPVGFMVGHLLEVVDKRSPRLLRRATVMETDCHYITVHFDAVDSDLYDYKIYEQSVDLHPTGWGAQTGHPISDDDDDDDDTDNCQNHMICRSVCSTKGPNYPVHLTTKNCPYSIGNLNAERFTDRVVVFEDKYYDLGQVETKPVVKPVFVSSRLFNNKGVLCATPGQVVPKKQEIVNWSHVQVSELVHECVCNLPTAGVVAEQFRANLIDGESFLMLTQSDMTDALGIKLGPAVKIFNLIRLIEMNK